jgi:hypothetical protein
MPLSCARARPLPRFPDPGPGRPSRKDDLDGACGVSGSPRRSLGRPGGRRAAFPFARIPARPRCRPARIRRGRRIAALPAGHGRGRTRRRIPLPARAARRTAVRRLRARHHRPGAHRLAAAGARFRPLPPARHPLAHRLCRHAPGARRTGLRLPPPPGRRRPPAPAARGLPPGTRRLARPARGPRLRPRGRATGFPPPGGRTGLRARSRSRLGGLRRLPGGAEKQVPGTGAAHPARRRRARTPAPGRHGHRRGPRSLDHAVPRGHPTLRFPVGPRGRAAFRGHESRLRRRLPLHGLVRAGRPRGGLPQRAVHPGGRGHGAGGPLHRPGLRLRRSPAPLPGHALRLGRTASESKAILGARPEPGPIGFRYRHPLLGPVAGLLAREARPRAYVPRHPFRGSGPPGPDGG